MAKKFGKILLFTAAVGTAAAAVYHYMQKKGNTGTTTEDEDYDDFSEDLDEAEEPADASRNYVPLTPENKADAEPKEENSTFTPLEQVAKPVEEAAEKAGETVEEFFDEEEGSDEEPPINDN